MVKRNKSSMQIGNLEPSCYLEPEMGVIFLPYLSMLYLTIIHGCLGPYLIWNPDLGGEGWVTYITVRIGTESSHFVSECSAGCLYPCRLGSGTCYHNVVLD